MASEGLLSHIDVGSGSPVVFLHGFGLDARMWSAQVSTFRCRFRVLAPNLPGFGPSGAEAGMFSHADEVFRLLSSKALGPVHLVGLSYGGAVAVDLLLSHPEAIRTLVLLDPLLLGERSGIEEWASCVEKAKAGDLPGARAAWLASKPFERLRAEAETQERTREMVDDYPCGQWLGTLKTLWKRPDPKLLLEGIACPTLVITGEKDLPSARAMAKAYATTIPRARLQRLKGLGHMGPMEAPEHINAVLLDFLETEAGAALPLPSSPRLDFRTWQSGDVSLAMQLWGDSRVTSFVATEPFSPSRVEERLRQEVACQTRYGVQYGPIFLRATGELVGCCGFRPRTAPGVLELGFLLRPQFWGQGFATEAAHAAVLHAFGLLGAKAVFAGHHPENWASRHVLEKLGFRQTHLETYPPTGLKHPSYLLNQGDLRQQHPTSTAQR